MHAWSGDTGDAMGPSVTRASTAKPSSPPLKNGSDLRESGYLIAVGSRTARFRRRHKNKLFTVIMLGLLLTLLCVAVLMTVLYAIQKHHKPVRLCRSRECLRSAANLALSMDVSVNPCDNFYQYVCGNWAEDHPRPDAYRSYDWFREKQIKVYALVRDFLNRNFTGAPKPVQQAKDMFAACVDTESLDKQGLKPVFKVLKHLGLPLYPTFINASQDTNYADYSFDWLNTVTKIKTELGMDVLIGFDIFTDPRNSSIYRLVMGSPETTNPFPSLLTDRKRDVRRRNIEHNIMKTLDIIPHETFRFDKVHKKSKASDDNDEDKVAEIYKLIYAQLIKLFAVEYKIFDIVNITETELDQNIIVTANEYYTMDNDLEELESFNDTDDTDEDFYANIPDYSVIELQTHTDEVVASNNGTAKPIWKEYLQGIFAVSDVVLDFEQDRIIVSDPDLKYMATMAAYVARTPPVLLELYIWMKVVEVMAIHTTSELRLLFQRSYDDLKRHRSDTGKASRSLQCANAVNDMLGMAVAYGIADPRFLTETKPKIQTMLYEMKNALAHLVGKARWMDDDTKLATYQKIIQMKSLIGFPEWLLQEGSLDEYYKGVEISKESHLDNMINIIQVKVRKALNRFRKENNYTWATDPTEVNAYHTFQENTITVPLVMLQYPFFDLGLDSLNYGSLGTVLGHEITHGFDNFGRQFDKNGNLLPWWSNETIDSFVNMTQCFVDQYSHFYVPELDEHVDGKKTLGENIADNGGVREALAALKHHLRRHGPEPKLPGFEHFSAEQMFFLSFGNLWCGVSTKDSLKDELEDEHSPQGFRAVGALQNNEEFSRAFHCKPGSLMNPNKRCIIF